MVNLENTIITIPKTTLSSLPAECFTGNVKVIDNASDVDNALKELRKYKILGFDTETRPSFKKGQSYKVALIQLSSSECTYLFRTNLIGFPQGLMDLLGDENIIKVGVSTHDDFHNINKIVPLNPKGVIELQTFVKRYKIADNSLSRLYGIIFGKRISKAQRLTNWEVPELSAAQINYAALDSYACLSIYNHLIAGKFNPLKSEFLTIQVEPSQDSSNM